MTSDAAPSRSTASTGDLVLRCRSRCELGDRGSAAVWTLLIVPVMVLSAGLVVDGGRAISARQEAIGLASEASRSAVDQMDLGTYREGGGPRAVAPGAAQAAACTWVARSRADAACRASTGPDGLVQVTVTLTYSPVMLGAVGVGPRPITGQAEARPAIGDDQEVTDP